MSDLVRMQHNLSASLYNMMIENEDHQLQRLRGRDGNFLHDFPKTRREFRRLKNSDVRRLLDGLDTGYSHCRTDADFLQELGMKIGVHPAAWSRPEA